MSLSKIEMGKDPFSVSWRILTSGKDDLPIGLTLKRDDHLAKPGRPTLGTDGILTNTLGGHLGPHHLFPTSPLY